MIMDKGSEFVNLVDMLCRLFSEQNPGIYCRWKYLSENDRVLVIYSLLYT
jgi:hypothetical protein